MRHTALDLTRGSQTFYGSIVGVVAGQQWQCAARRNRDPNEHCHLGTSYRNYGGRRQLPLREPDPGNYKLEVDVHGFRHYVRQNLEVNVEAAVRNDINMVVGNVSETVEVQAAATQQLQTESATWGVVSIAFSVCNCCVAQACTSTVSDTLPTTIFDIVTDRRFDVNFQVLTDIVPESVNIDLKFVIARIGSRSGSCRRPP